LIDAALTARGATLDLIRQIERAGPFGSGNPEPAFALAAHRIVHARVVGADHVRARLRAGDGASLDAIAFRAMGSELGKALLHGAGQSFHVAARLSINVFRGREAVETRIVDLSPAS
jgi:single-stranded-DNA-specific exonuclease